MPVHARGGPYYPRRRHRLPADGPGCAAAGTLRHSCWDCEKAPGWLDAMRCCIMRCIVVRARWFARGGSRWFAVVRARTGGPVCTEMPGVRARCTPGLLLLIAAVGLPLWVSRLTESGSTRCTQVSAR
eukprot:4619844-Prymnesium_polylepis.2